MNVEQFLITAAGAHNRQNQICTNKQFIIIVIVTKTTACEPRCSGINQQFRPVQFTSMKEQHGRVYRQTDRKNLPIKISINTSDSIYYSAYNVQEYTTLTCVMESTRKGHRYVRKILTV
jgi:hypothetical protein